MHQLARQGVIEEVRRSSSGFVSAADAIMVYIAKKGAADIETAKERREVRQQVSALLGAYFKT